jgi:hypothetical protein
MSCNPCYNYGSSNCYIVVMGAFFTRVAKPGGVAASIDVAAHNHVNSWLAWERRHYCCSNSTNMTLLDEDITGRSCH